MTAGVRRTTRPMKSLTRITSLVALTLFIVNIPVTAGNKLRELDDRIRTIIDRFDSMQADPATCIPREALQKARAILLMDRTKAGFLFAYQGGNGVALARNPKTGGWSAPAFVKADEASIGVQVGVQQSFVVALYMTDEAAQGLTKAQMVAGGEARGTAGNETTGTEATTDKSDAAEVKVFYDREGVYGGAALKGGNVEPDAKANWRYYGEEVSASDILFGNKVKASDVARELAAKIETQPKVAASAAE